MHDYLFSDNYVSKLTGNEFPKEEESLIDRVVKFYNDNYGGKVERKGLGTVYMDKRGVKDSISHGIGRLKSAAFAAVPEIIKDGMLIDQQENYKGRNQDSFTIAAPVEIGDRGYVGVVIVTRGKGNKKISSIYMRLYYKKNSSVRASRPTLKRTLIEETLQIYSKKIASVKQADKNLRNNNNRGGLKKL